MAGACLITSTSNRNLHRILELSSFFFNVLSKYCQAQLQHILCRATPIKWEGWSDSLECKVCDLVIIGGFLHPRGHAVTEKHTRAQSCRCYMKEQSAAASGLVSDTSRDDWQRWHRRRQTPTHILHGFLHRHVHTISIFSLKAKIRQAFLQSSCPSLAILLSNPHVNHAIFDRGTQEMKRQTEQQVQAYRGWREGRRGGGGGLIREYSNEVSDII